jgi:hypothetical protein
MIHAREIFRESAEAGDDSPARFFEAEVTSTGPHLNRAALYGLAGDFVDTILPHTEADPAALLINFLVGFGSIIGRNSFYLVEGTMHYGNLFAVLVGDTSKGRKGTAWNRAKQTLAQIDPTWAKHRIHSGLSSGEGLIAAAAFAEGQKLDPRLLVIQPEFASTLAVMARQGNTLSAIIREAWDSGNLQTMVRRDALRTDGAHVSIIGHITREELLRQLNNTEAGNGFANRFLWIRSERSKCLPEGGSLEDSKIMNLAERLRPALEFAMQPRQLSRDNRAREVWASVYPKLSEGGQGLLGAVTSRAEAQVLRLSVLFALLDRSSMIALRHLEAALALWDYAAESAEWIFGNAMGDPVADSILQSLLATPGGISRSEISASLGRNQTASRISAALQLLVKRGLAHASPHHTEGRSAEIWKPVRYGTK